MNNTTYDRTKVVAQYVLPAVATLYFALAEIWHLPKAGEVVATITALDTFLGVLLGVASKKYSDKLDDSVSGDIQVSASPDGRLQYLLVLKDEKEAAAMVEKAQATFNILTP